jgi:hypothetical protein
VQGATAVAATHSLYTPNLSPTLCPPAHGLQATQPLRKAFKAGIKQRRKVKRQPADSLCTEPKQS